MWHILDSIADKKVLQSIYHEIIKCHHQDLFIVIFIVQGTSWVRYIDTFLLIICGGIPWQPYYQRALAVKTTKQAQVLSLFSTIGCFLFMIPPVLIGGIAKSTNITQYGNFNITENPSIILPVSLASLVPYWVSIFGLSAIRYVYVY